MSLRKNDVLNTIDYAIEQGADLGVKMIIPHLIRPQITLYHNCDLKYMLEYYDKNLSEFLKHWSFPEAQIIDVYLTNIEGENSHDNR